MLETIVTRRNPLVDPALHVWGWEIPVYLFLGGWVAGILVLAGHALWKGESRRSCVCLRLPLPGLGLLSLGMLALFLDLENKLHVLRLYVAFQPSSPMWWGAWILAVVYPVLAALALVRPPAALVAWAPGLGAVSRRLEADHRRTQALGAAGMAAGAALGVYTGILLSCLGARPLWNSALLGPLFLVSGLSCGAAFAHLVARDPEESEALARADNIWLWTELALIALFLIGLGAAGRAPAAAAGLLLGGPYTAAFWVVVVGLGILTPLLIQSLALAHRVRHSAAAPVLVLLGGLALRIVIVSAGQYSHWARVATTGGP